MNSLTKRIARKIAIQKRRKLQGAGNRLEAKQHRIAATKAAVDQVDHLRNLAWETRKANPGWRVVGPT